jgi:U3 small nucleolar RNA-associated protein 4
VHRHDVRALTVAAPEISEQGDLLGAPSRKKCSYRKPSGIDYQKWARPGVPMLISGGDDTKLYAYPANTFLDFYPHDICPAPQRLFMQLASEPKVRGGPIMLTQYPAWLDVSMINVGMDNDLKAKTMDIKLGKRKGRFEFPDKRERHLVAGNPSKLLARIKCKASQRIICSAISESGNLIAFSDRIKPRLFELKMKLSTTY